MSEIFTASNGRKVRDSDHFETGVRVSGVIWAELSNEQTQALREYFLAERDKELGRWRDPEAPNNVVIPDKERPNRVVVSREDKVSYEIWWRDQVEPGKPFQGMRGYNSAKRYFEAHPEKKPWHDAEPGEWWEITFNGKTYKALVDLEKDFSYKEEGSWGAEYINNDNPSITAGRKL